MRRVLLVLLAIGCADPPENASPAVPDVSVTPDAPAPEDTATALCTHNDPCNDQDPCTSDDRCVHGVCEGTPYLCDDGLECTLDRCDGAGGCTSEVLAGSWCFIGGACIPDGTPHPTDPCLVCATPVVPFDWSPHDEQPCDDGLMCTGDDRCRGGVCKGTTKAVCDDGNPCTTNGCKEGQGCIHAAEQGACEDGDLCTLGDTCLNTVCNPGPMVLDCADGDPCTQDLCDGGGGCLHPLHNGGCDDGNPCTTGDACVLGECVAGTKPLNCDDANPCTTDACLKGLGCAHVPNLASCEDGDPCTTGDTCSAGECTSGFFALDCDDGKPCTNDICEPFKGCAHLPAVGPCDDGNPCTENDICVGTTCQGGQFADCDDGDPCTDDLCTKIGGCTHVFNSAPCNDGDPCTEDDHCQGGACVAVGTDCDDQNPCTFDSCLGAQGCLHELLSSDGCQVEIHIYSPVRGRTLTGSQTVTVKGTVDSPAGPLVSATLNGKPLVVGPDGKFTATHQATHGLNVLHAEAVDALGNTDKAVRSFYFSTAYQPMTSVAPAASAMPRALYLYLGPPAIDDGNHAPTDADDLATIFELLIGSFDVGALLPNPLVSSGEYEVTVENVTYQKPKVQLVPIPGGLSLYVSIKQFNADIDANGKCFFCPSASGDIRISEILIITDLLLSTWNGKPKASLQDPEVILLGLDVDINGILGSIFDFLVDFVVDEFAPTIEDTFVSQLGAIIPGTVEEALGSLAFDTTFQVPAFFDGAKAVDVQLKTGLETMVWDDDGGQLRMWTAAVADKHVTHQTLGTLRRDACLSGGAEALALSKSAPLQIALGDDLISQILYAVWWGGGLQFPVPASLLGNVDLSGFGIDDVSLTVDFLMPPIITSCNPLNELRLQIGDIQVAASMTLFGQPVDLDIFASAEAWVDLVADGGQLGLSVAGFKQIATDVVVKTAGFKSAESLIDELVASQLTPMLFDLLGGEALAGFPLPEIDLSALADGLPPGTVIAIDPKNVSRTLGWSVVSGQIK